ncbi:MAG: hypothetical protein IH605_20125 [Burkholderiales bacterium]|nr:hypothetical protein [Burkholderiales bacterium]
MSPGVKPKHAFIAYCALAERLSTPGVGIMHALTPFLAEACEQFAGELFDAAKFSAAVAERYGIRIPRLAALGLAEQLARDGVLTVVSGQARSTIYQYATVRIIEEKIPASPVKETEVEVVLASFVQYCRSDDRLGAWDESALQTAFLDRLLNADSMRILGRREVSIGAKKTAQTLVLAGPANQSEKLDKDELHLDFLVSQFLLDLRDRNAAAFERVSDIAFANMAAEAIACFQEPRAAGDSLDTLTVYLDSPLLLDMLGVNSEYADYGREMLDAINASGAKAAVFDHCIAEAESAVHAQLSYLRSGVNQIATSWGTTARPDLLQALIGNVSVRAEERLGIAVHRDPEINLHKRSPNTVGDIEAEMERRMHAWGNAEAKEYDRKSVWAMLAIRDSANFCRRICDSKKLFLTRNTALVGIANHAWMVWLGGATKHSQANIERWAPVAMSDKQFAGYLWARSGTTDGTISRSRLLAHCSAAVRPRADVKARAYNLVLELSGREGADDIAALLEDREGARALMRATRGDPEDVTRERLPFILEKVKLAAGEFAAAKVREESDRELSEAQLAHQQELERFRQEAEENEAVLASAAREAQAALMQKMQDQQSVESQNAALRTALAERTAFDEQRKKSIFEQGLVAGAAAYQFARATAGAIFGLASGYASMISTDQPLLSLFLIVLLGAIGFAFAPSILERPLNWYAMQRARSVIAGKDAKLDMPSSLPDFKNRKWDAINESPSESVPDCSR